MSIDTERLNEEARIALVVIARDQEVVTRDGHFREVAGLVVEGW